MGPIAISECRQYLTEYDNWRPRTRGMGAANFGEFVFHILIKIKKLELLGFDFIPMPLEYVDLSWL